MRSPSRTALTSAVRSARPVDVAAMLNPVDQSGLIVLEEFVDDPIVPASCSAEALEFADQWFPEPLGVLGDRPEDGREGSVSNLVGQSVEVTQTLRGDLDFVHEVRSHVIAQTKPFALGSLPP